MCRVWLSFFLYTRFLIAFGSDSFFGKAALRLEKFEQCPDKMGMPNVFHDMIINQVGFNKVKVFGKINIKQEIVNPTSLKVALHKCASKEEPGTCEYYYTYTTDKFCQLVGQENMPWSEFWLMTTLPKSCPVKEGNYSINGANIDMNKMPSVPLLYGYWKARSTGKSGGKTWHCAVVEFSIGPAAGQNNRRKKKN